MDMDMENFMERSKKKREDPDIEKELDDLMEEDEEFKGMMREEAKGKKKKKNLEDLNNSITLSDLDEDEDEKNEEDLDIKALEDEEKNVHSGKSDKVAEKSNNKDKSVNLTEFKAEANTNSLVNETKKSEEKSIFDPYSDKIENLYHRVDKMFSMGVLQDEIKLMNEIIEFKKNNSSDYDFYENKKDVIEVKMKEIENMINFGAIDFNEYKKTIQNEIKWEEELMIYANKDTKITKDEMKVVVERISKRKEIIDGELSQEIVEEEEPVEDNKEEAANDGKKDSEIFLTDNKESDKNTETIIDNNTTVSTSSINQSNCTVSNESTAPTVKQPEGPPEIVNTKLYDQLKSKLNDYKEAAEYFHKIGSAKQQEDAFSKAKELSGAVRMFEEGKENKVDEFILPIGVTPDYICNETKQERLNHFSEIIKEFSKRKNELNEALNSCVEKLKTVDKKELVKIKDAVKKDLDQRKAKIEFYNKLIVKLTDHAKNPWVPAPLYSYEEEEEKLEKINDDIEPYYVEVYIGNTTYDKPRAYLLVNLSLGEKQLNEYVYFKEYPSYNTQFKWKLEKSEWNNLFRKYLEVQVHHSHWYWPFKASLKGTVRLKLEVLKDSCQISDAFPIKLVSKRYDPKLDIKVRVRTPCQGKEYTTTSKTVLTITKTFPPFRGEGGMENHSYPSFDKKVIASDSDVVSLSSKGKVSVREDTSPSVKKTQYKPVSTSQSSQSSTKPKAELIDPSEFSKEELADPDVADNLNSVKVLEFKISKIQAEINAIDGRAPPKLREKLIKAKCKKNVLEQQLGGGFTVEDYIMMMNKQLGKDKRLAMYFEQGKLIDQGKKVLERIPILIREIEEAIDYAKGQRKK